eukprot:2172661-Pyramimonas_sp.AAC.1
MGSLGAEPKAERRKTRLAAARGWRLGSGLRWLLARRKVSACVVEVFVGRCDSVGLLVRQIIDVFVQAHPVGLFPMWPTVRAEFSAFL